MLSELGGVDLRQNRTHRPPPAHICGHTAPMRNLALLSLLLVAVLAACGSPKRASADATAPPELTGVTWQLEHLAGASEPFVDLFPATKPNLTFDGSAMRVTGTDGCNGYSADYTLDGSQLSFGEPGPSTLMYCGAGEKMFREAMQRVDRVGGGKGGTLVLLDGEEAVLRFRKPM